MERSPGDKNTAAEKAFAYAEFTPVKSRKNRKNNKRTILKDRMGLPPIQVLNRLRENMRKEDEEWFLDASRTLSDALRELALYPSTRASPATASDRDPLRVLCLGLGSPTSSTNANAQLAFLLETAQHLNLTTNENISLYDPVFTDEDKSLFKELGLTVLDENRDGRYTLSSTTLCFMLHCDMELYNSIISTNWSETNLKNFILVGNRLAEYIDSNPSQKLKANVPYLFHIASKLECRPFSASKLWPTAFNNTCVQYLPPPMTGNDSKALEEILASIPQPPTESQSKKPTSHHKGAEPSLDMGAQSQLGGGRRVDNAATAGTG